MTAQRVLALLVAVLIVIIAGYAIGSGDRAAENSKLITSDGNPATPDVAALFDALGSDDQDAVETQAAIGKQYFDEGGGGGQTIKVAANTPDVHAIGTQMSTNDVEERRKAMGELEFNNPYYGGEDAAILVRSGLSDSDDLVRLGAVKAAYAASIAYVAARENGEQLQWDWSIDSATRERLMVLVDDANSAIPTLAVRTIERIYPPSADIKDTLVNRYYSTTDSELQVAIVTAIGNHAYSASDISSLLEDARQSSDSEVRAAAAIATAQSAVPYAESVLTAMLQNETDEYVREAIEAALRLLQ